MKKAGLVLSVALFLSSIPCAAQGPLTPTNGPGPTMHTLEELYQKLLSNEQRLAAMKDDLAAAGIPPPPDGMVLIPSGSFQMGNIFGGGGTDEAPIHTVTVSGFYMDKFEVSNEKMREVLQWAYDQNLVVATAGGVTNNEGSARALLGLASSRCQISFSGGIFSVDSGKTNFPCIEVSWYGALAYCNYRSDMDGLSRCIDFSDWSCDFSQDGYRLPTEAEWEKASRGGLTYNFFPWPSSGGISYIPHIGGSDANYSGSNDPFETEDPGTSPVGYYDGNQTPAGVDMANGYGLYDMAGNVWEWCWDRHQMDWYSQAGATQDDTRGPTDLLLTNRVLRSGAWLYVINSMRCAYRDFIDPDEMSAPTGSIGVRPVRGL